MSFELFQSANKFSSLGGKPPKGNLLWSLHTHREQNSEQISFMLSEPGTELKQTYWEASGLPTDALKVENSNSFEKSLQKMIQ